MADKNIIVGKYNTDFNKLLGLDYDAYEIVRSKGLPSHLMKRKHYDAFKYIDYIPDIITNPDYVGYDDKEENKSIIYVKKFKDNVFLTVKLDEDKSQLYVSTFFVKEEKKINRMIHSGKLKSVDN